MLGTSNQLTATQAARQQVWGSAGLNTHAHDYRAMKEQSYDRELARQETIRQMFSQVQQMQQTPALDPIGVGVKSWQK